VTLQVQRTVAAALGFDFAAAVVAYRLALLDHRDTEGVPAPVAPSPLVEAAVRRVPTAGAPDDFVADFALVDDPDAAPTAPAVPASVTNYQARAVLVQRGLFAEVDAAIHAADLTVAANMVALQAWDYANDFYRNSAIVAAMAGVLGLAPADVDAFFIAAAAVQ